VDAILLGRIQFGFTAGFHFIFPPITIGMAWLIFIMLTLQRRAEDDYYEPMIQFWLKLFTITFAIGVATGIPLEFQFGTNWADYSRFVGDIFGAPLAAEAIFTFFLESTFLGVLIFGRKRVSAGAYWLSSFLVAAGSTLSAFWIIVANSWQQTPAGFKVIEGKAILTDFWAAVFNPSTVPRYLHTVDGAMVTGAFMMMAVSAWYLIKGRHRRMAEKSLIISLLVGAIFSFAQLGLGHVHAVQVAETQPLKLAAIEGLFETQTNAPLLLFGIPNFEEERTDYAVEIPGLLSMGVGFSADTEVQGLKDFPKDEWPPLLLTFIPFHLMVGLGMYFVFLTGLGLLLKFKGKLYETPWFLWLLVVSMPLPIIANDLGWITAEVGRQPWIVYGMLKTADAISHSVPAGQILASLIMFILIYSLLFAVWVFLLGKAIAKGPQASDSEVQS
jgi:cytochrome bd ubiquinol oxidase subunit I